MQEDLGVFGIILIPGAVERIAGAGHSEGGERPEFKAALMEKVPEGAVLDARCLKTNEDWGIHSREPLAELVIVAAYIGHPPPLARTVRTFNENFMMMFGDVNGDKGSTGLGGRARCHRMGLLRRVSKPLYSRRDLIGLGACVHLYYGPEFITHALRAWYEWLEVAPLFIEPDSPWENGYVESFNGKLRDELLNGELFYTLTEAQIIIEQWRRQYNTCRPHSALGYRPTAPEARTLTQQVA